MRLLFVYSVQKTIVKEKPLLGQEGISQGISSIAGMLKKHGHECQLVVLDRVRKKQNVHILTEKIKTFAPQIVAFTAVYSEFAFICEMASHVKNSFPHLFLLAGGVHITLNPDERYLSLFDAICLGEGEYPTLELAQRMEANEPLTGIKNLWIKTPDGIEKNPTRPFIADLDTFPFPERDMWQEWIVEPNTRLTVLLGRGCPFNCTYCSNHRLRKVSPGKYVRMRSPENIVLEIENLHDRFPDVKEIYLEVETIAINLDWLENFCNQLHEFGKRTNFSVKFGTNLRVFPRLNLNFVFQQFKKANITSVTIGLESGSYRLRKEVLKRDYSNEIILEAASLAKSYGIDIALFNMIGLPTETKEEFRETLEMNQIIQPAFHATSIFFPYPGTELYEMCKQSNLLPEQVQTKDERQFAVLDLPGFSKKQIQKSFNSFHYHVYKVRKDRSMLKLFIYFSMCYLGHNFYADLKINLIRFFYKIRISKFISPKLYSIFQRSE